MHSHGHRIRIRIGRLVETCVWSDRVALDMID